MSSVDRDCNECGSSEWTEIVETSYPERRKERAQTVKTVYACDQCGAEGRHFDQRNDGTTQYAGAMR
jgi:hypothetical protein